MGIGVKTGKKTGLVDVTRDARAQAARKRIDFASPAALEAYQQLDNDPTPEALEELAQQFPIMFDDGSKPVSAERHQQALGFLQAKHAKASIFVSTGAEFAEQPLARISTGILSVDWVMNGGIPRGGQVQLKGFESMAKTVICQKTTSEVQRRQGRVLWVRAEQFDTAWARTTGMVIPFSKSEMSAVSAEQAEAMKEYNQVNQDFDTVDFVIGKNGDEILQLVVDAAEQNVYDLIVVDSIAVLSSSKWLENPKKAVGDEKRGGEAKMIGEFCRRLTSAFNAIDSGSRKVTQEVWECQVCGEQFSTKNAHQKCGKSRKKPQFEKIQIKGDRLRTAVMTINQMRDQGLDAQVAIPPDAPGGRGLRHMKGFDLHMLRRIPLETVIDGRKVTFGFQFVFSGAKSKIGPPHREAAAALFTETLPGLSEAGQFDMFTDLFGTKIQVKSGTQQVGGLGVMAGLVEQNGSWFNIGGTSLQGEAGVRKFFMDPKNAHVVGILKQGVRDWILGGGA